MNMPFVHNIIKTDLKIICKGRAETAGMRKSIILIQSLLCSVHNNSDLQKHLLFIMKGMKLMKDMIVNLMNQYVEYGYLVIALLILIENVFPPIPSEVILTLGGFMTTYTNLNVWGVIIFATIGSILGAFVLFGVGRLLSAERLAKLLDGRIGKVLHFKKDDVFKACDWFNNRGKATVLICRCVPIVRSLISIPAGMANMNFWLFLLFTTIGSFLWNIVLVHLGVYAGASWEKIVSGTDVYQTITVVILGIAAVALIIWYIRKRRKDRDIS